MALSGQLGLDYDLAQVSLVLLDTLDYVVSDLDEVLLLDDEAKGLQYLLLVSEVLVAPPRAHGHAGRPWDLAAAGVDL